MNDAEFKQFLSDLGGGSLTPAQFKADLFLAIQNFYTVVIVDDNPPAHGSDPNVGGSK